MTFDDVLAAVRGMAGRRVSVAVGRGDLRLVGFAGRLMGERQPPGGMPDGALAFAVIPEGASSAPGAEHCVLLLAEPVFERGEWRDTAHGRVLEMAHAGVVVTIVLEGA